jgi:hypothetical protein
MGSMTARLLCVLVPALAMTAGSVAGQDTLRADADVMEKKLISIAQRGAKPLKQAPMLRTAFTDREVNAYFKVKGPEFLPTGLVNPELFIEDGDRVRARATVDLDAAMKPSLLNPLSWIGGTTEVTAVGVVRAADGKGVLQIENATLAGISIPKTVLQQLVSYYTRTPETPQGFDLDKPFALPSNIRSVETKRGNATVVQP